MSIRSKDYGLSPMAVQAKYGRLSRRGLLFVRGFGSGARERAPWVTLYAGHRAFGFPFGRTLERRYTCSRLGVSGLLPLPGRRFGVAIVERFPRHVREASGLR